MILAEVSTKVQTSPHGDNSVTVSGTTCTPSYMTPNQVHHKAHNILSLQSMQPTQKSVTSARAALLCAQERGIAAKLTVSRRGVPCGEACEQRG